MYLAKQKLQLININSDYNKSILTIKGNSHLNNASSSTFISVYLAATAQ